MVKLLIACCIRANFSSLLFILLGNGQPIVYGIYLYFLHLPESNFDL